VLALLAFTGLLIGLRWTIAAKVYGTNDVQLWGDYGNRILDNGLIHTYRNVAPFNQTPLPGLWAAGAVWLERHAGLPFRSTFKIPAILADVFAAMLLTSLWLRRERDRGVADEKAWRTALLVAVLFLVNPVSVLVTSFHGNTDSLVGMLCLLAGLLAQRKQPFAAGLALAAAFNIKLVPVFLGPPLLLWQPDMRSMRRFFAGAALGLLPFLPVIALAGQGFYQHVVAYNSARASWGLQAYLQGFSNAPVIGASVRIFCAHYEASGRYIIGAFTLGIGLWCLRGRRGQPLALAATAISLFLVLTPGFGVQYVAWPVALLFAVDLGAALRWSLTAGAMVLAVYLEFWNQRWDGATAIFSSSYGNGPVLLGLTAWLVLAHFVWCQLALLGPLRSSPRAHSMSASPIRI
jgi:Glycosyltransferase family 87